MRERLVASGAVTVGLLEAVAMAWQTRLIGGALDQLVAGTSPRRELLLFIVSIGCVLVLEALWQSLHAAYRQLVIHRLRSDVFAVSLRRGSLRLSSESVGELASRVNVDVPTVAKEYYETRLGVIVDVMMAVVYFVALWQITWQYSLAVTGFAALTVCVPMLYKKRISATRQESLGLQASYNAGFSGALRSLLDVRLAGGLAASEPRVTDLSAAQARREFTYNCWIAASNVSVGLTNFTSRLVLLLIGAYLILGGRSSAGDFIAAFQLSALMVQPVVRAARAMNVYSGGSRAYADLASAGYIPDRELTSLPQYEQPTHHKPRELSWHGIEVSLLDGVRRIAVPDTRLAPGTNLAIAGPSGCGKTTLSYALCGLIDLDHGQVFLDGVDITTIPEGERFALLQFVPQDGQLMKASIIENLDLGRGFALPEIRRALALAGFDQLAQSPEHELRRECDSSSFSGGERQRLCLARALVTRPSILVLDEALSQVDLPTRTRVMAALFADPALTVVFISHHLESGDYETITVTARPAASA